ncbi:hypothetical protein QA612_17420 [Evansella sp. AB-P1]|uniref:hypothetical protein n=1 Tax=Evansella sp. AB-P1 TaxID=3037653 RepID=UPI00241FEE82|nr:hypothetical protein [Evansella sp. AB-P1]MDG5789242.1 hypothetical protein [Evansella sp. AB-P1]
MMFVLAIVGSFILHALFFLVLILFGSHKTKVGVPSLEKAYEEGEALPNRVEHGKKVSPLFLPVSFLAVACLLYLILSLI